MVTILFSGKQCQIYDTCLDNLCARNSTCLIQGETYGCDCLPGTHGEYCQFDDTCVFEPCGLHGECIQVSAPIYLNF